MVLLMLLNHPLEIEVASDQFDNRVWKCTVCGFSFAEYHLQRFCKGTIGHPAIWRDRYAVNGQRRPSGGEWYGGYLA